MKRLPISAALLALAACAQPAAPKGEAPAAPAGPVQPVATDVPAGRYTLDKAHASLVFRVDHIGFSQYTGRFETWDATLDLDPANPSASRVSATIDPRSLGIPAPPAGFLNDLKGPQWLDTAQFPQMSFRSTSVEMIAANAAHITGELTFRGVTKPVTLEATFNGGYAGHPMDPNARIGFSAHGALKRSEFGLSLGVPPPGSTMGVGDEVAFAIEAEFNGPAWTPPPATQEQK
ncbi:MAG: polyisoprenoid-binding protein [Hyphomonadaceae bacterium]|nr:polyisoprenoid-binding protein [Hyphomonadaceae bacterium]